MTDRERPVIVVVHARARARERFRISGTDEQIDAYIVAEVRAALAAGRTQNNKPKEWRLYGEKGRALDPGERFVYDAENTRGWIIKRTAYEDVVTTSLNRTGGVRRLDRVAAPVRR